MPRCFAIVALSLSLLHVGTAAAALRATQDGPRFETGEDWIAEVKRDSAEAEFCARPNVQCANHPTYAITFRGFSERDALLLVSRIAEFPGYEPDGFPPKKLPAILSKSPNTLRIQYPSQAKAAKLAEWLNLLLPNEGFSATVAIDGLEIEITATQEEGIGAADLPDATEDRTHAEAEVLALHPASGKRRFPAGRSSPGGIGPESPTFRLVAVC